MTHLPDKAPNMGLFKYCKNENKEPIKPPNNTEVTGSDDGILKNERKLSIDDNIDLQIPSFDELEA